MITHAALTSIARVKQSWAIDPFETEKIHSGTTGLVNNWRQKLLPPTPSPSSRTFSVHGSTATPHNSTTTPHGSTVTLCSMSGSPLPPPPNRSLLFTIPVTRSRCARYAFSPGISTPPLSLSTIDSCREALNQVATHPPLPTSSPCAPNQAAKIATVGRNLSTPTHHIPSPPNPTVTPLQRLYCRDSLWFATRELVKSPSVSMCRSRLSRLSPNPPIMCRVD